MTIFDVVFETKEDRDYFLNTIYRTFLHIVKETDNNHTQCLHSFIKSGTYHGINGIYSTIIPTINSCISFDHQILHKKNSPIDFVAKFYMFDVTTNQRLFCSGYNQSSTDTVNTASHIHLFNVCKNHEYVIGVESDNDTDSITILKGSQVIIKPVIDKDSRITEIITTKTLESGSIRAGSFLIPPGPLGNISINMMDISNPFVTQLFNFLPQGSYSLKLKFEEPIFISTSESVMDAALFIVVSTCSSFELTSIEIPEINKSIRHDPFDINIPGTTNSSQIPCLLVSFGFNLLPVPVNVGNPIAGTFIATPIVSNEDTLLISGNHLSLNTGISVDTPHIPFLLDFRGVTKSKNIQLVKYDNSYSCFVTDTDMVLDITYFIEATSTTDKVVNFYISKNNSLTNPKLIPESKLEITLVGNGLTERYKKNFLFPVISGQHYYVYCDNGGGFIVGPTTMLYLENVGGIISM